MITFLRILALWGVSAPIVLAFSVQPSFTTTTTRASIRPVTTSTALNGGGSGYATSTVGKQSTVEKVKGMLGTSEMIFSMPCSSLTVPQIQKLRASVPETTTVKIVKNTLMERAVAGTSYQAMLESDLLTGANMWFFIEEGGIADTLTAVTAFVKEVGKKDSHVVLGGVLEGQILDGSGVEAVGKLPTKLELYARIAGSIKAVPTKVARVLKAPSSKLARAIKLATAEDKKD